MVDPIERPPTPEEEAVLIPLLVRRTLEGTELGRVAALAKAARAALVGMDCSTGEFLLVVAGMMTQAALEAPNHMERTTFRVIANMGAAALEKGLLEGRKTSGSSRRARPMAVPRWLNGTRCKTS